MRPVRLYRVGSARCAGVQVARGERRKFLRQGLARVFLGQAGAARSRTRKGHMAQRVLFSIEQRTSLHRRQDRRSFRSPVNPPLDKRFPRYPGFRSRCTYSTTIQRDITRYNEIQEDTTEICKILHVAPLKNSVACAARSRHDPQRRFLNAEGPSACFSLTARQPSRPRRAPFHCSVLTQPRRETKYDQDHIPHSRSGATSVARHGECRTEARA